MDTKAITEHIHRILTAPDVDLATISSKKVRKVLAESFGASLVKENKEAIDALIIDAFNRIATAAGATTAQPEPTHSHHQTTTSTSATTVKTEGNNSSNNGPSSSHAAAHAESSNSSISHNNKQRDRQKQQQPEESDVSDEDDDASAASDSPPPQQQQKKSKPPQTSSSSSNLKQSPQKRKIEDVASSSFPASSPNVPLSMTTGLTDEEYARKLQEEFNNMASLGGGRSTRGSSSTRPSKKTKKSSTSKRSKGESSNGSSSKYRSKAYIDDSDLEGEEGHDGASDSGSDAAPKKKKRKAPSSSAGGGGSGGGYNKELALSESLQKVCGVPTMSRPKIVKRLWEYIREHDLQDPNKRSDIINDDLFKEIFGVEKMTMFSMNKYLTKNVSPIDG